MRRAFCRRILSLLLTVCVLTGLFCIPASANSGPRRWQGLTHSGATFTDENCPIEATHEKLTLTVTDEPVPESTDASFWADYANEAAERTESGENPEHRAVFAILRDTQRALEQLEAGKLPWPWGSAQYREMHEACRELHAFSKELAARLRENPKEEISSEDSRDLREMLNELADCSAAYRDYKTNDLAHRAAGSSTAQRQSAAELCGQISAGKSEELARIRKTRREPVQVVRERMRGLQAELTGKTGNELRELTAKILYLNAVTSADLSHKQAG